MSLYNQYKMDDKKESEGVWIRYEGAANDDGTIPAFHILRLAAQNQRYVKSIERESAPYRRLMDLGTLDDAVSKRILRRVFCSSVLLGWENIQNKQNQVIPHTFDNALKLFDELPELYYDLAEQAAKLSTFRAETMESDAKN